MPDHPHSFDPRDLAVHHPERMGKATIFRSPHLLVGLNAFEPGQSHALHHHAGQDKAYLVLEGHGRFLLADREEPMAPGRMLIAPEGVPHGIRNDSDGRLLVLAILAPAPPPRPE